MFTFSLALIAAYLLKKGGWKNPASGLVSSPYGNRSDGFHNGTDIQLKEGTPVFAAAAGEVTAATFHYMNGNYVSINHGKIGADQYQTIYLHLSAIKVIPGQKVKAGQLIGLSGNTGYSFGAHLHFSILKNGNYIDAVSSKFFKTETKQGSIYFS